MKVKMNSENNKVAFFEKIKLFVRGVLILSARKLGAAKPKGPAVRNAKNLLNKEIKIPRGLSVSLTFVIISAMLSFRFGLRYETVLAVVIFM